MRRYFFLLIPFIALLLASCNALKYVPKDKVLLHRVKILQEAGPAKHSDLRLFLYQEPNKRFLGLFNLNLSCYNLSGSDSSKWVNRVFRKIGEAPVLFDSVQTEKSRKAMQNSLIGQGYFDARADVKVRVKKRRASVTYLIKENRPYTIRQYDFVPTSDSISQLIQREMKSSTIRSGMLLNGQNLDEERTRLTKNLMREGYYAMQKDFFKFAVDSALGTHQANVSLVLNPYLPDTSGMGLSQEDLSKFSHPVYSVRDIFFMLDVPMSTYTRNTGTEFTTNARNVVFDVADYDTVTTDSYHALYRGKPFVSPDALIANCRIIPGALYDVKTVERTYARLSSLQLMKYINIRFVENGLDSIGRRMLDCYIVLTPNKQQVSSLELEGTNTAGDFGVSGNLNITHRNLFKGAELFQVKVRGAYEALSATNFNSDYTEFGGELSMTLPRFMMPFLNSDYKKSVDANTQLTMSYQKMKRPEFQRTIASTGMRFNWLKNNLRQALDLIDISYVYMPWVTADFKAKYLNDTSYLKYSYEDHLILRTGYNFSYSSIPFGSPARTYYTVRGSIESAGSTLYALCSLLGVPKDGVNYKIGNISFAQYVKGDVEYARSVVLNSKSRMAYRFGLGVAYPFGNSSILPFEKRFFSGGANSVRGWSVRTLGPGSYDSGSSRIDFMNQSGDIKLDLGAEYRSSLFWKFESALFADVGNIWTFREYVNQPGGQFKVNTFYKQLASSVGAGLRVDFSYFLVRLDLGMKVFDPSLSGSERWRIKKIDNINDFALHFSIGYPF